jgi:Fe-S cluster assembly protein SufB
MTSKDTLQQLTDREYAYGFTTELEADAAPRGLSEDIIRLISSKKGEPEWLLEWRLKAYRHWLTMEEPHWQNVRYAPIDYQDIIYYSAPKPKGPAPANLDEVDPEVRAMFDKLGISLREQERLSGIAVDAVVDSVSVATTFKAKLAELGVVFCSFSEAVREHPELVRKYLGTVVPTSDNFFAALNSAVFTDGSFCFVPKGVRCPMELSTYFRINAADTGQFERTLIIAEDGAYVSYLEGCVPGWEEISCGDQLQTVRDVAVGDIVMNADGEEAGVAKIMRRGYRGDLIEVTPRSPGNRFHVTPEHPVLAIKRSVVSRGRAPVGRWTDLDDERVDAVEPDYVPAGELEPGDLLVFPINQVAVDDTNLSDDFLKLLGAYVSEGCATMFNGHKAVEFTFGDHEESFLAQTRDLVERLTGKRGSITHDSTKHGVYFVVYDAGLWDSLVEHGGKYAHGKRLSKRVMDLPPHRQDLFLETYYKGDGSLAAEGGSTRVRAVTVSRQLAFQLQELLSRQGIFAYINIREAFDETMRDGRVIRHSTRYQLFHAIPTRGRRAIRKGNAFLVPVREIQRQPYEGYVYNLETKTDPHSYLVKGFAVHNCTAPMRDKNQLHAAVVELVALDDAEIKYSTVQNWYPGDKEGKGGIYNFVTKRGKALGKRSKISWTQVETGSAITWKYPSVLLMGDDSVGEFYSVAVVNNYQQADTGTKMMHIGKNTSSTIVSKGISAGRGQNTYRGLVKIGKGAANARNYSQCDSLLIGDRCGAHTFPYIEAKHPFSQVEHEASTSKISEDQLFYCMSRGLSQEDAVSMIVNGFCKEVMKKLPMEFAVEAQKLLGVSLEGSVG